MKTKALKGGLARALSALTLSLLAFTTPAQAKDPTTGGDDSTKLNAVQVTGSRIRKAESTGSSPVLTLNSKDLEATGLASVGDVLQELSVSGSSLNTKFNSAGNFGFPANGSGVGSGSSTISLRNLGAQRTLVLVDGLRWVNESSASGVSGAVDLNTIPLSVVDRIEILADGASALYGSDAIGGVVNIITKKAQDGAALHAYFGHHDVGNGNTWFADASLGGNFNRGSFILDLSHFDQGAISSAVWNQSNIPVPGTGLSNGSSATPFGRIIFNRDDTNTFNGRCPIPKGATLAQCNITPDMGVTPPATQSFPTSYHHFTDDDRFNFASYNLLLTPQRRTSLFGQATYDLSSNVHWYLKGAYQARESINQAAPEPIFLGPGAGTGALPDTIIIDPSNPYYPKNVQLDANHVVVVTRRPVEGGDRVFIQDVNTRYFASGVQGEFSVFQRDFNWDVNYAGATNDATQNVTGTYNARHIQTAVGPVAACTNPCVPLDLFDGPGTITPAMLNYILFNEHDTSHQSIELATANLSGNLARLWAGDLDLAVGYEHRRYAGSYQPDQIIVQGDSNGVPSAPTAGSYTVNEYYAELAVPLLAKLPLAKRLDLSLATRYSSYVPFGGTTKSKLGLRWQPIDDLTLRVNYAGGFRAPTIGEAYGTSARFDATLVDHCDQSKPNPASVANCTKLGVPNGFTQLNPQISIQTGGNQHLSPETSHNFTAGFVYSPSWAYGTSWSRKLDLEVTYYRILMTNIINAPDAQTQLNACEYGGDPSSQACQGITRDPVSGNINKFVDFLQNLSSADTNGIDFAVNWLAPRFAFGQFGAGWQATYTGKFNINGQPDAVGIEAHDSGIPRWKSTLRLNWGLDPFSATWAVRYMSALREDCGGAAGFAICETDPDSGFPDGSHKLGQVFYNDVQGTYKLPAVGIFKASVSLGINNVFSQGAPVCLSCSLNGYDASNYDLPGRFYYAETTIKF